MCEFDMSFGWGSLTDQKKTVLLMMMSHEKFKCTEVALNYDSQMRKMALDKLALPQDVAADRPTAVNSCARAVRSVRAQLWGNRFEHNRRQRRHQSHIARCHAPKPANPMSGILGSLLVA